MLPEPLGNGVSNPTVKPLLQMVYFSSCLHILIIYLIKNWKPNSPWNLKCPSEGSHWDREGKSHSSCPFPVYNVTGTRRPLQSLGQGLSPQGLFISFIKKICISHMDDFWNKQQNPALPPFTHMLCSLHLTVSQLIPPTLRITGLHPLQNSYTALVFWTLSREWERRFESAG